MRHFLERNLRGQLLNSMNVVELLETKEYPGRFLIIGKIESGFVALYGVTARSAASRAKRYVFLEDKNLVTVQATDPELMAQGDLSLLQYNPVYFFENGIVIGNGRQTDEIKNLSGKTASQILLESLKDQSFEVDKYNTPRITGCVVNVDGKISAALHIIRADEHNNSVRDVYDVSLELGKGKFISTYNGPNIRPTPSFAGPAVDIEIPADSLEELVKTVYDALAPKSGEEDVRVSVIGLELTQDLSQKKVYILNSVDL